MKLSASQAAKAVGVSVPTITRAIKNGVISAERVPGGGYRIDASELDRFRASVTHTKGEMLGHETPVSDSVLRRENEMLREMLDREREEVTHLRARLDAEGEERRKLTAMLTHELREVAPTRPRIGWWRRLRG